MSEEMDKFAFVKQADCKARELKMISLLDNYQPGELVKDIKGANNQEKNDFLKVSSKLKVRKNSENLDNLFGLL